MFFFFLSIIKLTREDTENEELWGDEKRKKNAIILIAKKNVKSFPESVNLFGYNYK